MTRFAVCFMNHSERATATTSAAAATSCANTHCALMDAAFVAASIFVIVCVAGLLAGLGVSIIMVLVCLISVLGLLVRKLPPRKRANRVI